MSKERTPKQLANDAELGSYRPLAPNYRHGLARGTKENASGSEGGLTEAVKATREAICELAYVDERADAPLIDGLIGLLRDREVFRQYIDKIGGPLDARGRQRACYSTFLALESSIRSHSSALGLGAASRSKLTAMFSQAAKDAMSRQAGEALRGKYGDYEKPALHGED